MYRARVEGRRDREEVAFKLAYEPSLEAEYMLARPDPGSKLRKFEARLFANFPPSGIFMLFSILQPAAGRAPPPLVIIRVFRQ